MDVNSEEAKLWSENMCLKSEIEHLRGTLRRVNEICHVPSRGRHAYTHFMADFDEIRRLTSA